MALKEWERTAVDSDGVISRSFGFENIRTKAVRPWVKVYLDAWATFKNIKGFSDMTCEVLYQILCLYPEAVRKAQVRSEATNTTVVPTVSPTIEDKRYWEAALGTTLPVINNSITKLVKMGILERVKRGAYIINPEIIGCGSEVSMERLRKIRGTFEISADGAVVAPIIEGEPLEDVSASD